MERGQRAGVLSLIVLAACGTECNGLRDERRVAPRVFTMGGGAERASSARPDGATVVDSPELSFDASRPDPRVRESSQVVPSSDAAQDPEAPGADASSRPADPTRCAAAGDCTSCYFPERFTSQGQCRCPHCGYVAMMPARCESIMASWRRVCRPALHRGCPPVTCRESTEVLGCRDGVCVLLPRP